MTGQTLELLLLMCLQRTPRCQLVRVPVYDDTIRMELPTPCQRAAQIEATIWALQRPRWHVVRAACRPRGAHEDKV